jgi:hypothetical protein
MFASAPNIAANGEWRIISIVLQTRFNTTLRWNGNNATMSVNEPGPSFFGPMGDATGSGGGIAGADGIPNGNLLTAKCDFAEAIVYNAMLTDAQRLAIEQYLNVKYNVVTGVKEQQGNLPEKFVLDQNYPNPFNPATTFSFTLPSQSFVSLKVFDALGREVATLASEEMSAGSHSMRWDASKVPSGVYYYRLQAGTFIETKQAVLLK